MEVQKTYISGLYIIQPTIYEDSRGYFFESFKEDEFNKKIMPVDFIQENQSKSCYGVIRGLHFQKPPFDQAKLVRCTKGSVLDVAVDIRRGSPTYGQFFSIRLSEQNHTQLFIPRGFAHGFSVLTNEAIFEYKCQLPMAKAHGLVIPARLGLHTIGPLARACHTRTTNLRLSEARSSMGVCFF